MQPHPPKLTKPRAFGTHRMMIQFPLDLMTRIAQAAGASNVSISEWIRQIAFQALDKRVVVAPSSIPVAFDEPTYTFEQMAKIQEQLNQQEPDSGDEEDV